MARAGAPILNRMARPRRDQASASRRVRVSALREPRSLPTANSLALNFLLEAENRQHLLPELVVALVEYREPGARVGS